MFRKAYAERKVRKPVKPGYGRNADVGFGAPAAGGTASAPWPSINPEPAAGTFAAGGPNAGDGFRNRNGRSLPRIGRQNEPHGRVVGPEGRGVGRRRSRVRGGQRDGGRREDRKDHGGNGCDGNGRNDRYPRGLHRGH